MIEVKVIYGAGVDTLDAYYATSQVGIQKAIDYVNSQGGGKIFITKGLYLISADASGLGIKLYSNIEIYGEGYGTILKPNFSTSGASVISAKGTLGNELSNIIVRDLVIGGDTATKVGYYGMYCEYVGKTFTPGLASGTYSRYDASTNGVTKINKKGVTIKDCIIQNNSNIGILSDYLSNSSIEDNLIHNNGMQLVHMKSSTVLRNTIQNISVGYGIDTQLMTNCSIANNIVQNVASQGISLTNTDGSNLILGNIIQNNGGNGILTNSGYSNTIVGNTIQNNKGSGISLNTGTKNTITGNTLQNNNNYGIDITSSSTFNTITGNTVQNNGYTGISLVATSTNNTITGNTTQGNNSMGIQVNTSNNNIVTGNASLNNYSSNVSNSGSGNEIYNVT